MNRVCNATSIAKTAIIHEGVVIEEDVIIHDFVVIYPGTIIKKGTEIFDHCVLGKIPTSPGVTSRKLKTNYNSLIIGENCVLCPGVVLYAGTTVGHHNLFGDYCSVREECLIRKQLYFK